MTDVLKKSVTLLVVAFVLYYLLTEPRGAADAVEGAVSAVGDAFSAILTFFSELTG